MIILFDLDGTLIDSTQAILQSFEYAFADHNTPCPPRARIKALIGHPLDFMFAHLGVNSDQVGDFVDSYKHKYREINRPMTSFLPGAKSAVEAAAEFADLGVVTTKTGLYSRQLLEHMGIMHYFQVLIGREDVQNPKPHPEPILKAIHKLHGVAKHTWMIGDTPLDINAARKANIKSIAVKCGYGDHDELRRCSEFVTEDAWQAVELIAKIAHQERTH